METLMWQCPQCQREFSRKNQRHVCGTCNGRNCELNVLSASAIFVTVQPWLFIRAHYDKRWRVSLP